jgi:hypothetical protein
LQAPHLAQHTIPCRTPWLRRSWPGRAPWLHATSEGACVYMCAQMRARTCMYVRVYMCVLLLLLLLKRTLAQSPYLQQPRLSLGNPGMIFGRPVLQFSRWRLQEQWGANCLSIGCDIMRRVGREQMRTTTHCRSWLGHLQARV